MLRTVVIATIILSQSVSPALANYETTPRGSYRTLQQAVDQRIEGSFSQNGNVSNFIYVSGMSLQNYDPTDVDYCRPVMSVDIQIDGYVRQNATIALDFTVGDIQDFLQYLLPIFEENVDTRFLNTQGDTPLNDFSIIPGLVPYIAGADGTFSDFVPVPRSISDSFTSHYIRCAGLQ